MYMIANKNLAHTTAFIISLICSFSINALSTFNLYVTAISEMYVAYVFTVSFFFSEVQSHALHDDCTNGTDKRPTAIAGTRSWRGGKLSILSFLNPRDLMRPRFAIQQWRGAQ